MAQKVLLVRNAYSHDFGGGEQYPVHIANELKNEGFDVLIATRHKKILELAKAEGITVKKSWWWSYQNFSGWRIIFTPIYCLWIAALVIWYLQLIKRQRVDVVHLQSRDDFIAGTIAAKLLNKRVVWTDHADLKYIFRNSRVFYKNPVGKLVAYSAKKADAIIVVSKNELQLIKESLKTSHYNFVLIHNGIREVAIKPERPYPSDIVLFVATSRLVFAKGIQELVDASRRLFKDGEKTKTLILGDGPDASVLMKGAPENVEFLGFHEDALNILAGGDIFVHPTYNEAFSLSLVEAAMLSKPVITTNVGGNPEIIIDKVTGILIPPQDMDSLYAAMKYSIANQTTMKSYGENLHKKYLKEFQLDEIVRTKLIPLYNDKV